MLFFTVLVSQISFVNKIALNTDRAKANVSKIMTCPLLGVCAAERTGFAMDGQSALVIIFMGMRFFSVGPLASSSGTIESCMVCVCGGLSCHLTLCDGILSSVVRF